MKCQVCKQGEATIPVKQVYNGQVKELSVCEECASKITSGIEKPMGMVDFLFGIGTEGAVPDGVEKLTCPVCGLRGKEFRKESRLGCPACYETFAEQLAPVLQDMQRGPNHVGKMPRKHRVSAELAALQQLLNDAVAAQNFEEAAVLRDRIVALKSGDLVPGGETGPGKQ